MNAVRRSASSGISRRLNPFVLVITSWVWSIWADWSSWISSGSFWYSAKKATSSRRRRFQACWIADSSSSLKRSSQATRDPASIFFLFFR